MSGFWCSIPVLFLFRFCSWGFGHVLVHIWFMFLFLVLGVLVYFCSYLVYGSCSVPGGSVCVSWGSGSGPILSPNCGSVLGPVDIFKFLLRKKG